ncbi:MAG: LysM peptidoglycan-binding domain-containing protein [Betaproteobacteria bacterium]|nr:LysM peptidoglycan-binding domain-containing protein [Betaproteobacteria bacterium]
MQRGDTLWSIAGRYLTSPWRWPQLWNMNREQVRNPHRIYPGDVLVLDRASGRISVESARMSPRVRSEDLADAVPTISPGAIQPFVSRPLVLEENQLENAPHIVATQESRVVVATGDIAYVRGLKKGMGTTYHIYRRGDPLIDPENGATLGYMGLYLGEAQVRQFGDMSRVEITRSTQEIVTGDRLIPVLKEPPVFAFVPRAPDAQIRGRVMSMTDNIFETGRYSVVSLSKGAKDGLQTGHVLALHRSSSASRYALRTSPIFGRTGPTGSDATRPHNELQLNVRGSPIIFDKPNPVTAADIAKIPDERYGLAMVFRTFERASFALIMQSTMPVAVDDVFTTP